MLWKRGCVLGLQVCGLGLGLGLEGCCLVNIIAYRGTDPYALYSIQQYELQLRNTLDC